MSMGRLTLNVLLSFAQFEREVTSERIRDKIAAAKRKGMWMGGNPPLGYEVRDRALVINEAEAEQVHHIMARYIALGSTRTLAEELIRDGYHTRQRYGRGGAPFSRGALCHLLGNAIYQGKVIHKGAIYDGQHEAIVDQQTWDDVQACLAEQHNGIAHVRSPKRSLLVGLVYDGEWRKMTPSHTAKGGKPYRYYVTHGSSLITAGSMAWRISAPELERIVVERLKRWLEDRRAMLDLADIDAAAGVMEAGQRAAAASTSQLIGKPWSHGSWDVSM